MTDHLVSLSQNIG